MIIIEDPYQLSPAGMWLRGNLHTHTTRSDGSQPPQKVIDDYAARRYDFLMLSDHDIYTSPEDLARLDARGMVLIPGNEVTAAGPHLLHVNAGKEVEPNPCRQVVLQEVTATGGGFSIVCHPNWQERFDHATIAQLTEWTGYAGIEIYNGVIGILDGSPYATNKWDMLLSRGRRVWGYAHDDHHGRGPENGIGLGWNMVYAQTKSREEIVAALQRGRFYASTGIIIKDIRVHGAAIRIETANAARIVALRDVGKRIAQADERFLEVEVPPDANYVRFECWGTGEQFAWTQPFFVRESL